VRRIGIVAAALGIWGGCTAGKPAPVGPDGGAGAAGTTFRCLGNTTCGGARDGGAPTSVFECEQNHTPGKLLMDCADDTVCSLGRCVSRSCATGEMHASATGCLFYIAVLDNVASDDYKPTLIVVTNPGPDDANVKLQERTMQGTWSEPPLVVVRAGHATSFTAVKQLVEASPPGYPPPDPPPARRVVSDAPVTVMMVESDDADNQASSSAGTMVLPAHALGTNYMTMSYQQLDTPRIDAVPGSQGGAAEYTVVATQDHTTLWIYAPLQSEMAMPMPVTLQHDGDEFHRSSMGDHDSLAGTVIVSDQRVAVFSGNVTTTYGPDVGGLNSPDMAMEQMMPTGSWSHVYVAAHLPPQAATCDSIFPGDAQSYWQIIASDESDLTFYSASGKPIPGLPETMTAHVSKGASYPFWVTSDEDFVVKGSTPILVTQGLDCEPTLASAVPGDAPSDVQVFTLAPNFDHMLAIVRKNAGYGLPVKLDNIDITDHFSAVSPGLSALAVSPMVKGFEVARVLVPPCLGTVDQCVHTLTGAWGMSLRGMDTSSSYSTTFPSWVQCLGDSCSP
jgi:hypothetical protein